MKKKIELIFLTCSLLATYSVAGSFVDKRDGRTYKTVKIGEQVWMAENLKYKVSPSYCFGGLESNCQKYGRMYPWHVAMKLPAKKAYDNDNVTNYVGSVHQGLCPAGWHVPTVAEFDTLVNNAGIGDESAVTRKLSTDPTERFLMNPQKFNLRYGGILMILGFEYYGGFKEIDPTAGARFFKTGKGGEYPLKFLYKDLNHAVAFTTTEAEDASVLNYSAYTDRYNFEMTSNRIYRGASADYLRCKKDFECPKGEELYEGFCQKPFDCDEDEYFVDKWNCQTLPENGRRNKGTGFSCKKGFVKVKEDDEYVCKEMVKCGDDEYNISKFECASLPNHSKKTKNGFTCDKGYDKVKEDGWFECIKPYSCVENEYSVSKYECKRLPQNAHRDEKTKIGFECDEGFDRVEFAGATQCRKAYDCQENEYSLSKYECKTLPPNAHKNEKEGFSCDANFDEKELNGVISCEIPYVCDATEYAVDKWNCSPLPNHAKRKETDGFICDEGYDLYQGECYPLHP